MLLSRRLVKCACRGVRSIPEQLLLQHCNTARPYMACHMALNASVQPVSTRSAGRSVRAAPLGRGGFFGGAAQLAAARPQRCRRAALRAQAFQSEWPDPDFIKETKEAFPDKGVATVEEARVGRRC